MLASIALFFLFFLACDSHAQPVTVEITGEFLDRDAAFPSNRSTLGTGINTITLEYIPPPPATLTPNSDGFTPVSFGRIRETFSGSYPPFRDYWPTRLTLTLRHSGSAGSSTYQISVVRGGEGGTFQYSRNPSEYASIDGVSYSSRISGPIVQEGAFERLREIQGLATRGGVVLSTYEMTVTKEWGQELRLPVGITTFPGERVLRDDAYPEMITIRLQDSPSGYSIHIPSSVNASADYGLWIQMEGTPGVILRIRLNVLPIVVNASVSSLNFTYQRGSPPPPAQTVTVTSSYPITVYAATYNDVWLSLPFRWAEVTPARPATFVLHPSMQDKSLGFHLSELTLVASNGATLRVATNFYVADGPTAIHTSILPGPAAGSVFREPDLDAPPQGSTVTLVAIPKPGYSFVRWTGAVNSPDSRVPVLANGPTYVNAEFTGGAFCTYTFSRSPVQVPATGDIGRIDVTTQPDCAWTATSSDWVTLVAGASGRGSGAVSYLAQPNLTNNTRSTMIRFGQQTVTMAQAPQSCVATPPSLSALMVPEAGQSTIQTLPAGACNPIPDASQTWFRARGGFSPANSYQLIFDANSTGRPRTGSLWLAGYRIPVLQGSSSSAGAFSDVGASHPFVHAIALLKLHQLTDGCAPGRYCPDAPATRAEMALMLTRAMLGTDQFTSPSTPLFSDVPSTHPRFKHIQKLAELGVTQGCGGGRYCPGDTVTRGQMAAFLVRARARIPATRSFPFPAQTLFADVPPGAIFFDSIQKLREWGVTTGCSATAYCPNEPTTLGQMAVFLVRTLLTE